MPVTDPQLLSQAHLTGEASCPDFRPHFLKPNICTDCSKLITKHSAASIRDDQLLLKALEYSQQGEKVPSCVLDMTDQWGGLYLGGYRAVINRGFLKDQKVSSIVNTAKGLEIFGTKYLEAVDKAKKELNIKFLNTDWMDSTVFKIPLQDLVECVHFIHAARSAGNSVLVHCAQGKSRSATAVVAYIMASNKMNRDDALALVKERRQMAEPNPEFMIALKQFESSDELEKLQMDIS